jgi:hypothetical protein
MLATFNSSFVVAIPKNDNPSPFEYFKHVLVCNCIYNDPDYIESDMKAKI